ncbi:MAG: xanthine dehydrogenase molybdopterin binding subunit [Bradymonadales bacterium]|jgi:xanthine dehydrogenase large subunit
MKDAARNSPLHENAAHESAWKHITGRAVFIDDMPDAKDQLVAQIFASPVARGRIKRLDFTKARAVKGVAAIVSAADIPGHNDVSAIGANDEEILSTGELNCVGQAIALVLGENYECCYEALKLIELEVEELPAIFGIHEGIAAQSFHPNGKHIIARGDCDAALAESDFLIEGEVESPGQEHWYLETHCAQAQLTEDDDIHVYSSTQNLHEVQEKIAGMLGLPLSRVVVVMPRMGGGFGGKETQSAQYASLAALGAWITKRPVRVWLNRDQDMDWTGKRHPFYTKYRAGFSNDGKIKALHIMTYANCGWAHDLSRSILDRCLFHLDSSYFIPNLHFEGQLVKTNLPSNTAFRGFGGPQGFIATETVMNRAARHLDMDPVEIRRLNYYGESPRDVMQYGHILKDFRIPRMTDDILESSRYYERKRKIDKFNAENTYVKRGIGFMPVKFGISFTNTMLNQGGALVLIYTDGSVAINHGGAEMGQGLHSKMIAIAAHDLGVKPENIRLLHSRTDKVPNASATAASSGTDLNGAAIHDACVQLMARLRKVACRVFELDESEGDKIVFDDGVVTSPNGAQLPFQAIAKHAYILQISLAASGFYRTPDIGYDPFKGRGKPFHYYAYGVCVLELELSTLTGEYRLTDVEILHDVGDAIIPNIDVGQVEGAFVQGFGWLSTEELVWDDKGHLRTNTPSTYKIPSIGSVPDPEHFRVRLLQNATADAIYGSKAVGEPPFVLAIALMQALEHAIVSVGTDPKRDPQIRWPATWESVLRAVELQKT